MTPVDKDKFMMVLKTGTSSQKYSFIIVAGDGSNEHALILDLVTKSITSFSVTA